MYDDVRSGDVAMDYVNYNSTPTSAPAAVNAASAADPLIAVIVILSVVVAAAIFFVICGLFLKAEAHSRCDDRETTMDGLLIEPMSRLTGEP